MVASGIWKSQGNRFSPKTLEEISDTLTLASKAGLRLLSERQEDEWVLFRGPGLLLQPCGAPGSLKALPSLLQWPRKCLSQNLGTAVLTVVTSQAEWPMRETWDAAGERMAESVSASVSWEKLPPCA